MTNSVSDEDLVAYLDGALTEEAQAEVEAALAQDASLKGRLDALSVPMDVIAEALSLDRLGAPASPQFAPPPDTARTRRAAPRWAMAAAVALAFLSGGALTHFAAPPRDGGWMDAVAAYQALYAPETLADVRQDAGAAADVLAGFGAPHGLDLVRATHLSGLEFRRAQILALEGRPLLQMAYVTAEGTPVALCLIAGAGADRGVATGKMRGLQVAHWRASNVGYLMIGDIPEAEAERLAQDVAKALNS